MDVVEYIKSNEGLRLEPYKCTAGKLTIGYGRNLDDRGITEDEADILLMNDICDAKIDCDLLFHDFNNLTTDRQACLVDMMINLGHSRLSKFVKMIRAVNKKQYLLAAEELLDSRYAKQVPNRAKRNAKLMREG